MEENTPREQGFLDGPPKTMFAFGIACGIAVSAFIFVLAGGTGGAGLLAASGSGRAADAAPLVAQPTNNGAAPAGAPVPDITKDDYVRGDLSKAKVVMIEYSDYECPFCSRHHPTLKAMMDEFGDDVAWVYRQFPLTSIHQQAMPAATAALCAGDLGGNEAFWDMTDALFENQSTLGQATYEKLAADIGLNAKKFSTCLVSGEFNDRINNEQSGGAASGVTGTPGTFINGQLIPGAVPEDQIRSIIQGLL
ncbi:disulfide bond formation protein DsbA [Candidatus Uhrbacteria bacterium CG10_big_fil_rev_8_21_14_0_10_50_16]|uniref:Disulfide bond formation protein DsbA n=1 Tax=Candidatus Uhrbacteria bacterium CG10_big_fil_rev_8_21_14_0_10_50_16 TaxID=1975039 RepID=A0A2H0RMX3_9BACT|nr:MAG: disulfide bond formation protein DsbA [Candidatus Uhrbacteria bacterium CG10_big_fil_rev_8_21_14_0_10_50_16]